jgi:terminase small subunit-like protein
MSEPKQHKKPPPEIILHSRDILTPEQLESLGPKKESDPPIVRKSEQSIQRVLFLIATGLGVKEACLYEGTPHWRKWWEWMAADPELRERYREAKRAGLECWAEEYRDLVRHPMMITETKTITDKEGNLLSTETITKDNFQRTRLMADAYEWIMGKLKPDDWGESIKQIHEGNPEKPFVVVVSSVLDRDKPKPIASGDVIDVSEDAVN